MTLFLWLDVYNLTDNYHDGGSLLVIAESEAQARTAAAGSVESVPEKAPDVVRTCEGPEGVWVFPNTGCC